MLEQLVCPISYSLPIDPVLAEDGQLYERVLIAKHLTSRTTSPVTNMPMGTTLLEARNVVNLLHAMAESGMKDPLLDEWVEEYARGNRTVTTESGRILVFSKGQLTHAEFASWHRNHGMLCFFNAKGKHVRTEFSAKHSDYGMVCHYDDQYYENKFPRIEYASTHANHGKILHYNHRTNQYDRAEYSADHPNHGHVQFFDNGTHVRTEFVHPHPHRGKMDFYEEGKLVRTEFKPPHPNHGLVQFIEDEKLVRTEFHGTVHFFENDKHVCSKFPCGEVRFFKNGRIVRKTFGRKRGRDEC